MSEMPRKYIFATLRVKMEKDPPKIRVFDVFKLRALKNNFLDIFRHRSPYMNFEINRPLINIWNICSQDANYGGH